MWLQNKIKVKETCWNKNVPTGKNALFNKKKKPKQFTTGKLPLGKQKRPLPRNIYFWLNDILLNDILLETHFLGVTCKLGEIK